MASRSKKSKPAEVAAEHLEALSVGKQGYKLADSALELLVEQCRESKCSECGAARFKNNGVVKGPGGRSFQIVDRFASRNAINVGQNARRYELIEISPA